jgi:alpha-D-xyloside xylohydrolase
MIEHDTRIRRAALAALCTLASACGDGSGGPAGDTSTGAGSTTGTTTSAPTDPSSTPPSSTDPTDADGTASDTDAPTTGADETDGVDDDPVTVTWADLELTLKRGDDVLLRFPADGFQLGTVAALDDDLSYDPHWLAPDEWLTVESAETVDSPAAVDVNLVFGSGAAARLTIDEAAPGRFTATLVPEADGPVLAYLRLSPVVDPDEGFYGLGEYFDAAEHRGRVRAMQLEYDPDIESMYNEAHVPVPFVIGTRGWGLFVENPYAAVFDVAAAADDRVTATFGTGPGTADGLLFHLYAANHPIDVVRHYYATTGAPVLPATWALGPWIWRDENMDQAEVEADIAEIRALDLATSAIWIDRPYASEVGAFDFSPAKFTDPPAMISKIRDLGLRLALWHVPYVDDVPGNAAARMAAETSGYFPPEVALLTSDWEEPIDFTNPDAFDWWQDQIRTYTDMGIEGFKLDYAEDVTCGIAGGRTAWQFADGSSERTMHSQYVRLYHQVYAETLPDSGGFLLGRAGTYGDQTNVSVIWPGDLDATMTEHGEMVDGPDSYTSVGGLPAAVAAGLSLGPSGFPLFASDTGGYRHSPPDKETFTRWFEHTALTPVMQVGNSASQVPWQFTPENGFDEEMLAWYRDYARLHTRLFPYVWTYIRKLADDGRPIVRPLGLAYPELGVHPSDTYLLGRNLLVAPVVERGATDRTLTLPPGKWVDWWTGEVFNNSNTAEITVAAPLETLPLFLREGGIVPLLRPTIDSLAPTTMPDLVDSFADDPGRLYVRLTPSAGGGRFDVYDGTHLEQRRPDGIVLTLTVAPGDTFTAGVTFEAIAAGPIVEVRDNGEPMQLRDDLAGLEAAGDGWFATTDVGGTLWVAVGPGEHEITAASL